MSKFVITAEMLQVAEKFCQEKKNISLFEWAARDAGYADGRQAALACFYLEGQDVMFYQERLCELFQKMLTLIKAGKAYYSGGFFAKVTTLYGDIVNCNGIDFDPSGEAEMIAILSANALQYFDIPEGQKIEILTSLFD